jgi:hypothetical protein
MYLAYTSGAHALHVRAYSMQERAWFRTLIINRRHLLVVAAYWSGMLRCRRAAFPSVGARTIRLYVYACKGKLERKHVRIGDTVHCFFAKLGDTVH